MQYEPEGEMSRREYQAFCRSAAFDVAPVLAKAARHAESYGISAMNFEAALTRCGKDPSVPRDVRCWLLTIARVLTILRRTVHPMAPALLWFRYVEPKLQRETRKWIDVAHLCGLAVEEAKFYKDSALTAAWFELIGRERADIEFAAEHQLPPLPALFVERPSDLLFAEPRCAAHEAPEPKRPITGVPYGTCALV